MRVHPDLTSKKTYRNPSEVLSAVLFGIFPDKPETQPELKVHHPSSYCSLEKTGSPSCSSVASDPHTMFSNSVVKSVR